MSIRKCRECGLEVHNDTEVELFVKNKRQPYGRENICKQCFNRSYYRGGKYYESRRRALRRWVRSPKGREWHRLYREHNREAIRVRHRAEQKRYIKANPDIIHAENLAKRLVPLGSSCKNCGSIEHLQRHHPDYSKPLEIVTLCILCHAEVHYN